MLKNPADNRRLYFPNGTWAFVMKSAKFRSPAAVVIGKRSCFNTMFSFNACLKDPHRQLIRSFRMRRLWILWCQEYDVIESRDVPIVGTFYTLPPIGHEPVNSLVSQIFSIKVADTQTDTSTDTKAVFILRTTSYDSAGCLDARCRTTAYNIVRHWRRNWTWFNFCVSVVAMYNIVRYVNSAVKSMCSITATPDDIVWHRPMSWCRTMSCAVWTPLKGRLKISSRTSQYHFQSPHLTLCWPTAKPTPLCISVTICSLLTAQLITLDAKV